jgi:hypothetical protein
VLVLAPDIEGALMVAAHRDMSTAMDIAAVEFRAMELLRRR